MKWVYVEDIAQYDGQDVEIRGWVYNKRSSGKVRFLLVRDGTGLIQATAFSADKDSPLFQKFDRLTRSRPSSSGAGSARTNGPRAATSSRSPTSISFRWPWTTRSRPKSTARLS
jgi:hypothetical protein